MVPEEAGEESMFMFMFMFMFVFVSVRVWPRIWGAGAKVVARDGS